MTLETDIEAEAAYYFSLFAKQNTGDEWMLRERLQSIYREIDKTGTYTQTCEELVHGAKIAWRNSTRCIGRLTWKSLQVRDMRHLTYASELFEALVEHIQIATNKGKIRSVLTVFSAQEPGQPGIRIWNSQFFRYACYRQSDGSLLGDPVNLELTEQLMKLGWSGKQERTAFDLLPIAIQMPGRAPQLFEFPHEVVLEVPIWHPDYSWFADLGLKWHALPVISNMRLEIGGLSYTAAPFNGYYMGTEIGARNFGDETRYNMLPVIAQRLELDTQSARSLWKDRALVELNIAVLHSFQECGVTIVDHHTAAQQFDAFTRNEEKEGRRAFADWGWIVPPLSASTTPVFHRSYEDRIQTPNFFYQPDPWKLMPGVNAVNSREERVLLCTG